MQAHIPEERRHLLRQIENQLMSLRERRVLRMKPIEGWDISTTGTAQASSRGPQSGWKPYTINTHWGEDQPDLTAWFRAKTQVPKDFRAPGTYVELGLAPSREALVFVNGVPIQGLSENHTSVRLNRKEHLEKPLKLLIEAYTEHPRNPPPIYDGRFRFAEIRQVDRAVEEFCYDLHAGIEVAKVLDPNSTSYHRILDVLFAAVRDTHPIPEDPGILRRLVIQAGKNLRAGLAEHPSEPGRGKLLFVGHSHIDTAWLWTLLETRRKCGRTFSTVLSLMESFPEYTFAQSQPQLYEYTKEHYPEVYAGIKKRIKQGRWDPVGAPWVEMDSIISGGEALVRQMLYGNLFFEEEFGVRSRVAWLPDAFGYNWNLPQILKKAGIDIFITTKIDWSQVTQFPYTLFNWEGADGSRVIGLMPPMNYNGLMKPGDLQQHWDRIRQKNVIDELVYSFGWGDGGGGPTQEMIEMGKRMADVTGIPKSRFGTVTQYCEELLASMDEDRLPTWNDELYLEHHRGCQTSQAETKRNNRKMEVLLREAECAASLAHLSGEKYPAGQILAIWRETLTNQFHDILPGSSVKEVYTEADKTYARIRSRAEIVKTKALKSLLGTLDTRGKGRALVVFNTFNWARLDPVRVRPDLPEGVFHIEDSEGRAVDHQWIGEELLFAPGAVPPIGHATFRLVPGRSTAPSQEGLAVSSNRLENRFFLIELDKQGHLSRIFDKRAGREVLAPGARGNVLQMFHDEPHADDAWDFDFNFEENGWEWDPLESIEVIERGPLRAGLKITRKTKKSTLTQRVLIHRDTPRVDFETEVNWHERLVLLKVAFPVHVRARHATYEIQFGAIERATHRNTPFDRARFEYPHQRWVDLSEGDYGVALANDCKYGADVVGNVLRLSLLRAPTCPDPLADEGHHVFTYSLIPHVGDWRQGEVTRRAAELNVPMNAWIEKNHEGPISPEHSWVRCESPNVVLEALKKAERGDELILRLYEAHGCRGPATLSFGFPVSKVWECNLMEEEDRPLRLARGSITLEVKPYEIRTLKLLPVR